MKDNQKRLSMSAPLAAVILLTAFPRSAFPQVAGAGTLTGTVTDASGAVVPEARVVAHNEDTNADREVSTNGAGIYVAAFLQPGHYELSAAKLGFVKVLRKDVTLQVEQTLTFGLGLSVQTTAFVIQSFWIITSVAASLVRPHRR